MQSEVSLRDAARPPHPLVAAILAVTAADSRGLVVSEFDEDDRAYFRQPAENIGHDQVVAVLRWLADNAHVTLSDGFADHHCWTAVDLDHLADDLAPACPSNTEETTT